MWWCIGMVVGMVVLIALMVWCFHHRLVPLTNPELLGEWTPRENFGFASQPQFINRAVRGAAVAKNTRLVICGLVRNRQDRIEKLETTIDILSRYFREVVVLVVENDSNDDTRAELLRWRDRSRSRYLVEVLGCKKNTCACKLHVAETIGHGVTPQRLEKMAALRNKYVDKIRSSYADFDLVLVWDFDTSGSLYIDGILSSVSDLKETPGLDAICANGIYLWPLVGQIYYDTFAHSERGLEAAIRSAGGSKLAEHILTTFWTKTQWPSDPLHMVDRCFSGATLYRTDVFLQRRYQYETVDNRPRCEHDSITRGKKVAVNQNMINYILLNS